MSKTQFSHQQILFVHIWVLLKLSSKCGELHLVVSAGSVLMALRV